MSNISWFIPPLEKALPILQTELETQLKQDHDLYAGLNRLRDWVNREFSPEFELYLEDAWNERIVGETHFEYWLRSKITREEIGPIGYDVYQNHQDAKGVWHLDDYTHSVLLMHNLSPLAVFLFENRQA